MAFPNVICTNCRGETATGCWVCNPSIFNICVKPQTVDTLADKLRALPRYNNINSSYYMEDNELGLWLRYADVMRIINDHM